MSRYISADRPLALNTPLGNDVLLPIKVSGSEALSRPYRFKLEMLAEEALDFDRLVGREATLSIAMPGAAPRRVHGILRRVKEGKRVPGPNGPSTFLRYRAELVAPLWRLSRRVQSRVFRHEGRLQISVPDVLRQVLFDEWRLRVTFRLSGQYAARDHLVQYRESDLAFVTRLMEEEGIFYYFVQHEDAVEMIVIDSGSGCRPAQGAVEFDEVRGGARGGSRIHDWEKSQSVRAVRHTLRDYSFQKPQSWLEGQQSRLVPEKVAIGPVEHVLNRGYEIDGNEMLEVYDFPGGYAHRFDSVGAGGEAQPGNLESLSADKDRTVRLRMQEEVARCLKVAGKGDVADFAPGSFFRLEKHGRGDGTYLLTRVEHRATQPIVPKSEVQPSYANTFTCLPEGLPHRPRRQTRRPRIDGTQTAVVVGPAGAKTFVDRFGRIKVQFHWDRNGKNDANSSCWVRVAQTWAGYRIGAFFWPRVGDEVVVSFEEGDPDRPLVVGSVYNAQNMPPFELPQSVLTTGFKSGSLGGDPLKDFNGILFHDSPGHETVQVHGQTQTVQTDEARKEIRVGRYERTIVGGPFFGVPGSGSGGGSGDPPTPPPPPSTWDMKSTWGNVVKYGYGHCLMNNAGLTVNSSLGAYIVATLNPIALAELQYSATATGFGTAMKQAFGGLRDIVGGFFSYTVGATTLLNYGPSLIAGHGWTVKNFGPTTTACKLLVSLASLAQIGLALSPFFPSGRSKPEMFTPVDIPDKAEYAQWALEGLAGVSLAAVAALERRAGVLALANENTDLSEATLAEVRQITAGFGPEKSTRLFANELSRRVRAINEALNPETGLVGNNRIIQGTYSLAASNTTIAASHRERSGHPNPEAVTLTLDARGFVSPVGDPRDGTLDLRASHTAKFTAALANHFHRSQMYLKPAEGATAFGVDIDGSDGIRLRTNEPAARAVGNTSGAHIDVKSNKILLHSGGLTESQGPRITLDSTRNELTLAAGGAEGPRIVVGERSIEIVAADGIKIELGRIANDAVKLSNGRTSLTVTTREVQVQ